MTRKIRSKLTYANVISTLCLFLLLGGGAAFAAAKLAKNSVGSKQLKKNAVSAAKIKKGAVTAAKIKKGAVTTAAIKNGAVTGGSIAANTVTGSNINAPSTPFTQVMARLNASTQVEFSATEPAVIPLGSYTQPAGQVDQLIGAITISFKASCEGERQAAAVLVENPPANLKEFSFESVIGVALVHGEGKGAAATKQAEFSSFPVEGIGGGLNQVAPASPITRNYGAIPLEGMCKTGSGITFSNPQLDILGTN